jgi:hypothetical protein
MPSIPSIAARIGREGQPVTLRRLTGTGANQVPFDVELFGFVRSYRPEELTAGITQGDRVVRISDAEIAERQWPGPPRKGDRVVIDGRVTNVEAVETRRLRRAVAMHILQVRG